jgi:hypothetical protein
MALSSSATDTGCVPPAVSCAGLPLVTLELVPDAFWCSQRPFDGMLRA